MRIADFGLAKIIGGVADAKLTQTQHVMGTPHYMAPEQFERPTAVDHRADIYSLGVVLYEMLTGELPLGRFAPPSEKVQIDVRLDEVVLKTLQKEPERRYQQASEIKGEVETLGGVSLQNLPSHMRNMFGPEFVSKTKIGSWPLVHLAFGLDPTTGRQRVARGIIAFGNRATGFLAVGGMAKGVIAFGGIAVGVFTFGGLALGLITFGGLGFGLLFCYGGLAIGATACGGLAIGYAAIGGLAIGRYAMGSAAYGVHVLSDRIKDPDAREFFRTWAFVMKPTFIAVTMSVFAVFQIAAVSARLWVQRRTAKRAPKISAGSSALPR